MASPDANAALFSALLDSLTADCDGSGGERSPALIDGYASGPSPSGGEAGQQLLGALYAPVLALDDGVSFFERAATDLPTAAAKASAPPNPLTGHDLVEWHSRTTPNGAPEQQLHAPMGGTHGKRKAEGKRPRRSNPNRARMEKDLEIKHLRGKAVELERYLAALRASAGGDEQVPSLNNQRDLGEPEPEAESAAEQPCLELANTWKQLCLRQLKRRLKAEKENAKLRRALEEQLKASNAIRKHMEKASGVKEQENELRHRKRARATELPPTDPEADRAIFSQLMAEADASLREIDLVLEENGIFNVETAHYGAKMRERGGGLFLDVFATSVLPFDFEYTGRCVWKHYTSAQKHFGAVYAKTTQPIGPNDDAIMENFAMEMTSSNTRADFRLRQVVKRSVTPERVVIVWTTDGEPIEYMNKLTNFGFHERGYIVCRPPFRVQGEQGGEPSTVLQVCHRISPYESSRASPFSSAPYSLATLGSVSSANVDGVAQFVFSSLDLEVRANQEHIENLLLDKTAGTDRVY